VVEFITAVVDMEMSLPLFVTISSEIRISRAFFPFPPVDELVTERGISSPLEFPHTGP
jgi:hypothetical protein